MYAYFTYAEYLYYLKGTSFKVSATAFDRFKKAIISLYSMGTLSTGDERHTANSLCGRDPFNTGIKINFSKALFEKMIEASGDARDEIIDNEYSEVDESPIPLIEMEKKMIISALQRAKGKRSIAAKELGISERTLYRKINDFDIEL